MIHKVKHGYVEVVLSEGFSTGRTGRAPDLVFKGHDEREFAVFFAPHGTIEAEAMSRSYYDYYAPFEAAVLSVEKELDEARS